MIQEVNYMVWCIRNEIKIFPIRLETATETYKIGYTVNDGKVEKLDNIYYRNTSKKGTGVYDKIKELQKYFYNKNNK